MVVKKAMCKLLTFLFLSCFFKAGTLYAYELAGEPIYIDEVLPLFNTHTQKAYVTSAQKGIDPKPIDIPDSVKLGAVKQGLNIEGFIGETVFKDIILKPAKKKFNIELKVHNINQSEIIVTPRIVSTWYQAGFTTAKKDFGGELTYELLLSNDRNLVFNDKWIKNSKGGWVYVPPKIELSQTLKTSISPDSFKRILLKVTLSQNVLPGKYKTNLEIVTFQDNNQFSLMLPITIDVKPVKLSERDQSQYKLLLYTAFKINDHIERHGAYVNAMRLQGAEEEREKLLFTYLSDIIDHGFNGITIHDWDQVNLDKTLKMTQQLGIKHVVLHATSPVSKKFQGKAHPIVSEKVKKIFDTNNTELYFYGYDEIGGNKFLKKQLKLNKDIHALGGKSVNAVFWDDLENAINTVKNDKSKCFDIIAHSMGSHGQKKMYQSLPHRSKGDFCSKQGTEYLTYWHPHVENPVLNRIFMGFWLWASGFDGVIPHGYYFPSHIEKTLSNKDLKQSVSFATSPYDDWTFWLPGAPLRHHNSVYPSKAGPIGTLQWEGILSGNMDLKYVLTLESKLQQNINEISRNKIRTLLNTIRSEILQIDSPYMSDKESIRYLKKLESWKKDISSLLLN